LDTKNALYYGDNLTVLRDYVADESVDLVYLDPPFKSDTDYNAFFEEKDGSLSSSQIKAFEDTWTWDATAAAAYENLVVGGGQVSSALQAFRTLLGDSDMLAYISMMAPRLLELKRVMRDSASLYLHCDATASAHLRLLMDAIFGPKNFRGEIVWRRTNARSTAGKWPRVHDIILFYTKSDNFYFQTLKIPADEAKMPHTLITAADGKKYQTYELTAPGRTKEGESGQTWKGFNPAKWGRHWGNNHATMDKWDDDGLIHWPAQGGFPRRRDAEPFDPSSRTITVGDVWTDIDRINQSAKERLGFPTQKPLELLDRIITAGSKENDVVLDPFCGCGTTISVAQSNNRRWIGIDITQLAITLIKNRLASAHGPEVLGTFTIVGEPTTVEDAKQLARDDPYQFQLWALGLVNARPLEIKKGMDKGIDGRLYFHDEREGGKTNQVIISVKGGHLKPEYVRELPSIVAREKAQIGVLISLESATRHMRAEATSAGFYENQWWGRFSKIQLLTVQELLEGKTIQYPHVGKIETTFRRPKKAVPKREVHPELFDE
jgi:site-specific DNA-methyltransferase (adenine-specific)